MRSATFDSAGIRALLPAAAVVAGATAASVALAAPGSVAAPLVAGAVSGSLSLLAAARIQTRRRVLRRAARRLHDRLGQAEAALDRAGVGTWELDAARGTGRWSRAARACLGLDAAGAASLLDALAASSPLALVARAHPDDRDRVAQDLAAALHAGTGPRTVEYRIEDPAATGGWRRLAVTYQRCARASGAPYLAGTLVDVSRQRQAELERQEAQRLYVEARQANQLKDEFLATLSHELRTPLTVILGYAQVVEGLPPGSEELRRALEAIRKNALAQARLMDDLLDVSRIITGKLSMESRPVELQSVVTMATDALQLVAAAKGVTLCVLPSRLEGGAWVAGDFDRLRQVVWNLANNAVKFTPRAGSVEVSVAERGGRVTLLVRDDGEGIDPAFLPHVFDRFRQETGADSRRAGGLGLGLTIARHIVEAHGGTAKAESAGKGRGASFVVDLPAIAPPAREIGLALAAADVASVRPRRARALSGVRVLVVDDEPDVLALVVAILRRAGASVVPASSAPEALAAFDRAAPDVVVSDLAMPHTDGFDLLRSIRLRGPGRVVPVVALSAHARESERRQALAAGFELHLPKPIDAKVLVEAIERLGGVGQSGGAS